MISSLCRLAMYDFFLISNDTFHYFDMNHYSSMFETVSRLHTRFMAELHHHYCPSVVPRDWVKSSACRLHVSLSCYVLSQIAYRQYLPRSSFHLLARLPCRIFLSYGLHVVTHEVIRSSLRRLKCPAQDHFIFLSLPIISRTVVLSLTQMLVFLYL